MVFLSLLPTTLPGLPCPIWTSRSMVSGLDGFDYNQGGSGRTLRSIGGRGEGPKKRRTVTFLVPTVPSRHSLEPIP